jgi:hypothetical protein
MGLSRVRTRVGYARVETQTVDPSHPSHRRYVRHVRHQKHGAMGETGKPEKSLTSLTLDHHQDRRRSDD